VLEIIAEVSGNHGGDINQAKKLILSAKGAGADAVKLQTYTPDSLTIDANHPDFTLDIPSSPWHKRTLYEIYSEGQTPREWHKELFNYAREIKIELFSSPFSSDDLDFLESLHCPRYKIASFEAVDPAFIEYVASTKKPIIISCGIATTADIDRAIEAAQKARKITLLHCVSKYPTPIDQTQIHRLKYLKRRYSKIDIGFSDHSLGTTAPIAAVAAGARMIEKHITLDHKTIDGHFSMDPDQFRKMVDACQQVYESITPPLDPFAFGRDRDMTFARSVFIVKDMLEGEVITEDHLRVIRPGTGLPPHLISTALGKKIKQDAPRGTPLKADLF
jgi:pseudaminic acid synthase